MEGGDSGMEVGGIEVERGTGGACGELLTWSTSPVSISTEPSLSGKGCTSADEAVSNEEEVPS